MIRLYLKNYKFAELVHFHNVLSDAVKAVKTKAGVDSNPSKDLDEALVYLSGYMDAKGDDGK